MTDSAVDAAYQALHQAIIENALLPGTKLPEDEIAARFGISRTPVRAVLARLHAQGLVDLGRRRSASVARPTLDEAREVFAVRRALEREVVVSLLQRWSPALRREIEAAIERENAAQTSGNPHLSGRLAGEFHVRLAELSGNALLARYLSELVSRCSLILVLYGAPHSAKCSISEHRGVLAALKAGDAERALAKMDAHLHQVERRGLDSREPAAKSLGAVLDAYVRVGGAALTPARAAADDR